MFEVKATSHPLRNLSLYPAELRGHGSFQPFMGAAPKGQAERRGNVRHVAAQKRHIGGHTACQDCKANNSHAFQPLLARFSFRSPHRISAGYAPNCKLGAVQ